MAAFWPLLLSFLLSAALVCGAEVEKVRNTRVVVTEITLQPGEMELGRGDKPSASIYFENGSMELKHPGEKPQQIQVKAGEVTFRQPQETIVRNAGLSSIHFVRIDFLGIGSEDTWGTRGLAPHYALLFENQHARAYSIQIPAHTNEPQHTHKDRVVVCFSGASLKHLLPDGRQELSTLKTGDIVWRLAGTHIGQNLGDTDLRAIAVEPK